jgi:WD40 repeat protein
MKAPAVLVNDDWIQACVLFSPDGSMLVVHGQSAYQDKRESRLFVFDAATGAELWRSEAFIWVVEWTLDQKLLLSSSELTGGQDASVGKILVLDPRTGTMADCFSHPKLTFAKFLIAPDRKTLAIRGGSANFEGFWLIDLPSRKEITSTVVSQHDRAEFHGFSPDSRFFLVRLPRPDGGQMTLFDVTQGKITLQIGNLRYSSLEDRHAFSPDGRILALCRERTYSWSNDQMMEAPFKDNVVHLWDTQTGQSMGNIPVGKAIVAHGRTAQDEILDSLFFLQGSAYLCVVTGVQSPPQRAEMSLPWNHRSLWPDQANLNLFDVGTGQLVHRQLLACDPKTDRTGSLLAMESRDGKRRAIRLRNLQHAQEHFRPVDDRGVFDDCFGFVSWGPGQDVLVFSGRRRERTYLGEWQNAAIWFVDSATGNDVDCWRFSASVSRILLSADGTRLLVGHIANGQETLELYSLPPRRPWLYIFGWALLAGTSVELLGLAWRWWRPRTALSKARDDSLAGAAGSLSTPPSVGLD